MTIDDRSPELTSEAAAEAVSLTEPLPPPAPLAPTSGDERVVAIDILRGLALAGIFAANIRGFAGPAAVYFHPDTFWPAMPDRIAQAFIDTFIQGKFITIFAFLFGVGFTVQLTRSESRGSKFGWRYVRRLLVLLGFGLVHGLLIWWGDILLPYALTGFFLFFFRKRKDKTLMIWATILYVMPLVIMTTFWAIAEVTGKPIPGPPQPTAADLQKTVQINANGTFAEIQEHRMKDAVGNNWAFLPIFFMQVLALFLLGVLAWRRRFFTPSPESLPKYREVMKWALAFGIIGNATATAVRWIFNVPMFPPNGMALVVGVIQTISIPALSLGYILMGINLCHSEVWRLRLERFGAIGKTALSNYLLQSLIGTMLFYSYGLGLFGSMGLALLMIPIVAVYALQAVISPWWVARFQFGPAEWLWRSITYGKRQPFVRPATSSPPWVDAA